MKYILLPLGMSKEKTVGRPKMDAKFKKVRFSIVLKPDLIKRIERKMTPEKGRNALIEDALESQFKPAQK